MPRRSTPCSTDYAVERFAPTRAHDEMPMMTAVSDDDAIAGEHLFYYVMITAMPTACHTPIRRRRR